MGKLLFKAVARLVKKGALRITTVDGRTASFGDGSGPPVSVRFKTSKAQRRILADPELRLGEAFVDGDMVMEDGTIMDLLELLLSQDVPSRPITSKVLGGLRFVVRRFGQRNVRRQSKRNVAHHYDITGKLYELFLDADRQYSCAYFESETATLDMAQQAKKRHIAAKLLMDRDSRVLDIGCGWGGLASYLVDTFGAHVTGITLSNEQLEYAQMRVAQSATDRLDFQLIDYRDVDGCFDRIVSVGMFEHVGVDHYDSFFDKCRTLLNEDGVVLLHSIGRSDAPGFTNPWIAKYIFPGGYIPALSEVLSAVERSGLIVTDVEVLRLHYAETLRHWRQRFLARRTEAVELFDERFVRLWEFYLSVSEIAFRHQGMVVFQMQIAKRLETVPLTRGYIESREARLRNIEAVKRERPKVRLP